MDKPERDRLIIRRDGLLKLKRVIDVIDKLKQTYPEKEVNLKTDMYKFIDALGVDDYNEIKALLRNAESKNMGKFTVYNDGGEHWGFNTVNIVISNDFNQISKTTREEYHKINDLLEKENHTYNDRHKNKWWKLTHPAYWIYKIYLFFKKYPLIFLVILILLIVVFIFGWRPNSFDFLGLKFSPNNN